jgi:hypothetical protein
VVWFRSRMSRDYRYFWVTGALCASGFIITLMQVTDYLLMAEWTTALALALLWVYLICSLTIPGTRKRRHG